MQQNKQGQQRRPEPQVHAVAEQHQQQPNHQAAGVVYAEAAGNNQSSPDETEPSNESGFVSMQQQPNQQ